MSGGDRPQPLGSVIWINGAFGAGKSTVAKRLAAAMSDAAVFDPESLARLIHRALPPSSRPGDYQDSALWRHLTVEAVSGLAAANSLVIVPMTLIDGRCFADVVGALRASGVQVHHFSLTASPTTIRRRLLKRQVTRLMHPRSTRWALARIERCCAALASSPFDVPRADRHGRVDRDRSRRPDPQAHRRPLTASAGDDRVAAIG